MFLKRLHVKGFKSFADPTTLEFEPGVTVVVGPNGSGKSNVVDAVTWVLGAQGPRALRSQKMEDVIFAGTASRAALGRAEVSLTIDNSLGKLPIDMAEITITRTLFRNGESEYAINGAPCRLLDIQELLSDSGVGRQHHMIIGQGQLDQVLNARPEDRRSVIEEAAGVLKHRRRKERAERRLAATQENLERLGDLVREVRRQMRPLERQAAAARSHAELAAELAAVRRFLYGRELAVLTARDAELSTSLRSLEVDVRELRQRTRVLDAQASSAAAELSSRREEELAAALGELQGLQGRVRGTLAVIAERRRGVEAALDASADENVVASLEADASKLATELQDVATRRKALDVDRSEHRVAEEALTRQRKEFEATWGTGDADDAVGAFDRATERRALLERAIEARASTNAGLVEQRDRTVQRLDELVRAAGAAATALTDAEALRDRLDREVVDLIEATEQRRSAALAAEQSWSERQVAATRSQARAEALERALSDLTGAGGRDAIGDLDGVLGSLVDLVDVERGYELAVEAAIGASLAAVVVDNGPTARRALERLHREGTAGLVLPALSGGDTRVVVAQGATPLRDVVRPREDVVDDVALALDRLLAAAFCVDSLDTAVDLAIARPDLIVVTTAGDRLATSGWRAAAGSAVVTRAAVEEAYERAASDAAAASGAEAALREAREALEAARVRGSAATDALGAARSSCSSTATQLSRLEAERVWCDEELKEIRVMLDAAAADTTRDQDDLAAVIGLLPALEDAAARSKERSGWATEARATIEAKQLQVSELATELGLAEASLEERGVVLEAKLTEVERRLTGHAVEREEASLRRRRLEADLSALDALAGVVSDTSTRVDAAHELVGADYREQLEAARAGGVRLEELRRERADADATLAESNERERELEVESTGLAARLDALQETVRRELGVELATVTGTECPTLEEGATPEARAAVLATELGDLGPINPLALEELSVLEERHRELDGQVADVRTARRELQEVVRTLDEEIMATFASAAADVNEHFSELVATLFPGGQGRLSLTDPDDLLNTGVEIEVRPLGRNVRRVSLLSGGERSLAALAFLFAVFRSRPSPFYLMDEVEAALDDVNLHRFLGLIDEFRDEAQLVIVSHQKRTMEAADALYGVTMAPGGSSQVVSQKVERAAVPA
ncbi:MAG TPA: chromosome segregation protein SMC [Acidimicrobiales bacterium]|nr:chromosome segregation protein SMC [Acidimicrobiales bacterium]